MRRPVKLPGVTSKLAKGRRYYYWTRVKPWKRLPDPDQDMDAFMRKLADYERREALAAEMRTKTGTFGDAMRLYHKSKDYRERAENTRALYDTYLPRLSAIFGNAMLGEIKQEHIQRFIMDEHADTPSAADMMLKVFRIVFRWQMARDDSLKDPTLAIKLNGSGEHEPWPDHILEAALESDDDLFRRAVALHYYTGQRTGDVCRMTWNCLKGETIDVVQQKTGKLVKIDLHPALAAELEGVERDGLAILKNKRGGPLTKGAFWDWVTSYAESLGVHLVPHGLRKNAVNALLEAECSVAEVSAITGQSLQLVEHYAKKRDQVRIGKVAMGKWGRKANGKTEEKKENRPAKSAETKAEIAGVFTRRKA